MNWTTTLSATTRSIATTSRLEALLQLLAHRKPNVVTLHGDRLEHDIQMTMTVPATNPVTAGRAAAALLQKGCADAGLGTAKITALNVIDSEEHERRLNEPGELMGISEIALLFGITRQRASALQARPGFPQPLQILASGPVWWKASIAQFADTWERKRGRPRTAANETYTFYAGTERHLADAQAGDVVTIDGDKRRVIRRSDPGSAGGLTSLIVEPAGL